MLIRDLLNKKVLHIIINKKVRVCLELFSQKQISFSRRCHELQKNWAQACWRFSDGKKLPNAKCWFFVTLCTQLLYSVFLPFPFDFTDCLHTRLALSYGKGISLPNLSTDNVFIFVNMITLMQIYKVHHNYQQNINLLRYLTVIILLLFPVSLCPKVIT